MLEQAYQGQDAKQAREATLNERLNRVGEQLAVQCDRIESALSRIYGTPQKAEQAVGQSPTPIRPMHSMQAMVENLEVLAKRLQELRSGVERIA